MTFAKVAANLFVGVDAGVLECKRGEVGNRRFAWRVGFRFAPGVAQIWMFSLTPEAGGTRVENAVALPYALPTFFPAVKSSFPGPVWSAKFRLSDSSPSRTWGRIGVTYMTGLSLPIKRPNTRLIGATTANLSRLLLKPRTNT